MMARVPKLKEVQLTMEERNNFIDTIGVTSYVKVKAKLAEIYRLFAKDERKQDYDYYSTIDLPQLLATGMDIGTVDQILTMQHADTLKLYHMYMRERTSSIPTCSGRAKVDHITSIIRG